MVIHRMNTSNDMFHRLLLASDPFITLMRGFKKRKHKAMTLAMLELSSTNREEAEGNTNFEYVSAEESDEEQNETATDSENEY